MVHTGALTQDSHLSEPGLFHFTPYSSVSLSILCKPHTSVAQEDRVGEHFIKYSAIWASTEERVLGKEGGTEHEDKLRHAS